MDAIYQWHGGQVACDTRDAREVERLHGLSIEAFDHPVYGPLSRGFLHTRDGVIVVSFGHWGSSYPPLDELATYTISLGCGSNWVYLGRSDGSVISIPTRAAAENGCRWSRFGDRGYWRGYVSRSRHLTLTAEGRSF